MNKDEAKWLMESLRKIQFFSVFSFDNIDSILKHFQSYSFKKGKAVIKEGEQGTAFYIVKSGKVKVLKKKAFWMSQKLAELGPGDFFGEMSLVSDTPVTASIVAAENSELFVLLKTDFNSVLKLNPKLADELRHIAEKRKFDNLKKSS